jgi:hypothetical protein
LLADSVPTGALGQGSAAYRTGPPDPGPTGPPDPGLTGLPARSRRGPALAVSAAIVAAGLIVGGVLLLTRGSPAGHAATQSTSQRTSSTGSTPGAGSTPRTGGTGSTPSTGGAGGSGPAIPPAFAGTWAGTATMTATPNTGVAFTNAITFTLPAGATTGHVTETSSNGGCVDSLTLTAKTATVLTFSEPQTADCEAGTVTFTRRGASLDYLWIDINHMAKETGLLHRTRG